ncbi:nucleotidyltransferase domain-containing protein [Desulfobacterales bacterium HSG16]|nr:nucleotidyltransferase domain-containing protein [Desulfobacterales bacterium HSG16]
MDKLSIKDFPINKIPDGRASFRPRHLSIENIEAIVAKVCSRQAAVMAAWIFGSMAKGTAKESSDVDVAVLFAKDADPLLQIDLITHFEEALKCRLALLFLPSADVKKLLVRYLCQVNSEAKEESEPNYTDNEGGISVWWRWTPLFTMNYTFNTHGSYFDTIIAVYTSKNINGLTETINNDTNTIQTGEVKFQAQEDVQYYVALDG